MICTSISELLGSVNMVLCGGGGEGERGEVSVPKCHFWSFGRSVPSRGGKWRLSCRLTNICIHMHEAAMHSDL